MSKKKKAQAPKKKLSKKVNVMNSTFEVFTPGSMFFESVTKLKLQMSGKDMLDLMKFIKVVTESPEYKAYIELRNEILKEFAEAQKKLPKEKRKLPMAINMPKWVDLMNMESGLEIKKHQIAVSAFPKWKDPEKIFNAHDMELLEGLFEFA